MVDDGGYRVGVRGNIGLATKNARASIRRNKQRQLGAVIHW
jgi:hypothetical protein